MTRLAIIEPRTLIGEAVRDALESTVDNWDRVDLMTSDPESVGSVTEVGGQAALVQEMDSEVLSQVDVALFCGPEIDYSGIESLTPSTRAILVGCLEPLAGATPIVAGINSEEISGTHRIISPSSAVLMLSHLLAPLADCGVIDIVAHVLEPASARDQAGLDELIDQTRAILSLSDERPQAVFGTQLAFNLIPWRSTHRELAGELSAVLGSRLEAQIFTSQAGVFHCCSVGFFLRLESDPGVDELQALLSEDPLVETHPEPDFLGPVAAAGLERIQLGQVLPSPSKGYWVWAVVDNLICSANNALAIARY